MRINLRGLVLALTVCSALAATANALYASYRVQREQLIANTLESNRVYAAKLAESAGTFLESACSNWSTAPAMSPGASMRRRS